MTKSIVDSAVSSHDDSHISENSTPHHVRYWRPLVGAPLIGLFSSLSCHLALVILWCVADRTPGCLACLAYGMERAQVPLGTHQVQFRVTPLHHGF